MIKRSGHDSLTLGWTAEMPVSSGQKGQVCKADPLYRPALVNTPGPGRSGESGDREGADRSGFRPSPRERVTVGARFIERMVPIPVICPHKWGVYQGLGRI